VRPGDRKVTIKIPRAIYDRLSVIVDDSGFNSVTDFIVYVLRDLVSTQAMADNDEHRKLTVEEIAAIKKRLKTLGYL
jgi:Arc/MetJ-type ribon-helix-helix transcriptional regulator